MRPLPARFPSAPRKGFFRAAKGLLPDCEKAPSGNAEGPLSRLRRTMALLLP